MPEWTNAMRCCFWGCCARAVSDHVAAPPPANGPAAEDLNSVVRRVAGDSIEEIDRVIRALENVRDMMRNEGERVSREIAGYASLSHAAATAMKVIADSIHQWKDAPDKSGPRSVS
jgi:hypothetical protein